MVEFIVRDDALECCGSSIDMKGNIWENPAYDLIMELPTVSLGDLASSKREEIAELLCVEFSGAYCWNCRHYDTDDDDCEYCHRKSIYWQLLYESALEIADRICEVLDE